MLNWICWAAGDAVECGADVTQVGTVPKEMVAAFTEEVFIEPAVGARRDAVAQGIFVDGNELAAAIHAA